MAGNLQKNDIIPSLDDDMDNQQPRQVLLESLKGQEVRLPNLHSMFAGWPSGVNPLREELALVIDERLTTY